MNTIDSEMIKKISHKSFFRLPELLVPSSGHISISEVQQLYDSIETKQQVTSFTNPTKVDTTTNIKHVLIVVIEGLNARLVNESTMPFLSNFKENSVYFNNHYSSGNNTLHGSLGILYGQSTSLFFEQIADQQKSQFLELLNANGFKTRRFGHGLDSYRNIQSYMSNFNSAYVHNKNQTVVLNDIAQFQQQNEKTFSFYYYADTHYPYDHADKFSTFQPETPKGFVYDSSSISANKKEIVNRYQNSLLEADDYLERLLGEINLQETVVLITGDHGEAMFENNRLSHSSSLNKPQVKTPLLLWYPAVKHDTVDYVTSHIDIAPTVLNLLGIKSQLSFFGQSLLSNVEQGAFVVMQNQNYQTTKAAFIASHYKIIFNTSDLSAIKMIDFTDHNDLPLEKPLSLKDFNNTVNQLKQYLFTRGCSNILTLKDQLTVANFKNCHIDD